MKRYPPALLLAFAISFCNMGTYRTSKLVVSLFAAHLGAEAFGVGLIVSLYAAVPFVLAIYAGRITDRLGMLGPMLGGTLGVILGLVVPWLWPVLPALYVSAGLLGGAYVFYHVAIQNMVGTISTPETRTSNFSTYSLVLATSSFVGPLVFGYAIDRVGHAHTYLLLALVPVTTVVLLVCYRRVIPMKTGGSGHGSGPVMDLLAIPALRRVLITSGIVLTGIDLFSFYLPIYGHAIGLSATVIGAIVAMFALANLVVRLVMPTLVRRHGEEVDDAARSCDLLPPDEHPLFGEDAGSGDDHRLQGLLGWKHALGQGLWILAHLPDRVLYRHLGGLLCSARRL